ncbi:hypothetical protein A5633_18245 [Mycolicibacterium elephantis]|uniref:hypothetical protein n=1 Tax=Mycolicibacterium elephantis TaxID=81858 RepID=UPI0007E94455|nr:hypothetical protein [Mycolicibacterium elephantis]OBA77475.1 hypothetical protein A5633_18245 [Mycolicibacterium elephantis]
MSYPRWSFFPRNIYPPTWASDLVDVTTRVEKQISTVGDEVRLTSDAVLRELRPELESLGFIVETSKTRAGKIRRPVLFGENGKPRVSYEIDAFHDEFGIAVEVEAGRGVANNADYRNIVRTALILDATYLVLFMPIYYRTANSVTQGYKRTLEQLDAIYASRRLQLPFRGILLVGY